MRITDVGYPASFLKSSRIKDKNKIILVVNQIIGMEKKEVVANEETTNLHTERHLHLSFTFKLTFSQIKFSQHLYKVRGLFNYLS